MNKNIPWDIIIKRLKYEISEEEQAELDVWLAEEENKAVFRELQLVWLSIVESGMGYASNADTLWKKMELRMKEKEKEPKVVKFSRSSFRWLSGAASILLFLLLSATSYMTVEWYKASTSVLTYSSFGGKSKVILPDGTHVWLNTESTLEYSTSLWTKKRNVHLKGEAYFEVAKDPDHLFTVKSGGVAVKVYGTVFNVEAHEKDKNVNVSLLSGSVLVENSGISKKLEPGEIAVCPKNEPNIKTEKSDVAFSSMWAQESVRFEKQSIRELTKYLSKWYGVKIILDPSVPTDQAYTFSIKHEPLEEVLRLMARVNPIQYSFDENNVVIITNKYKQLKE